jgi:very-short-patch-repair endonuclease
MRNRHAGGFGLWWRRSTASWRGRQLLELGFHPQAIKHRLAKGRLHVLWRGVYAVGRPQLTQHGRWMAAVLSCGAGAVLSHFSSAALWGLGLRPERVVEVSVPLRRAPRRPGIVVHRRTTLTDRDVTCRQGIPVTTAACTLIDVAPRLRHDELEAAINEADKLDLVDPEELRSILDELDRRPGVRLLRKRLDRETFTLTDSGLERRFLPLARRAGLPRPDTGRWVNGFKVDFYWPGLGLIVETDGLRYHRTPAQQARDRLRDQAHSAAGMTALRFTHAQVRFDPRHVEATLAAVARGLGLRTGSSPHP